MTSSLKPFKTLDKQLELLQSRKMLIPDEEAAKRILQEIGYYRLSQYSFKFKDQNLQTEDFFPDTTFHKVVSLYRFDELLRSYLYAVLAKIEIALRARFGHFLGELRVDAQNEPLFFPQTISNQKGNPYTYDDWHDAIKRRFDRALKSHNPVAVHHNNTYNGQVPIWVFVDFFDFSDLSHMYALMESKYQYDIADSFGLQRTYKQINKGGKRIKREQQPTSLIGWLERLTVARNICAHHARLWDTTHIQPVGITDGRHKGYFTDIPTTNDSITGVYGVLTISLFLLEEIVPDAEFKHWVTKFKNLILTNFFDPSSLLSERDMEFPDRKIWVNIYPWNAV